MKRAGTIGAVAGAIISGILIIVAGFILAGISFYNWDTSEKTLDRVWWNLLIYVGLGIVAIGVTVIAVGYTVLRRSKHAKAIKRTRIVGKDVRLYEDRDSRSPIVAKLEDGEEVTLGPATVQDGVDWVKLTLSDGRSGYVLGNAPVNTFLDAVLVAETPAYKFRDLPLSQLEPFTRLASGTKLRIVAHEWDAGRTLVTALLPDGEYLYIRGRAKVEWL